MEASVESRLAGQRRAARRDRPLALQRVPERGQGRISVRTGRSGVPRQDLRPNLIVALSAHSEIALPRAARARPGRRALLARIDRQVGEHGARAVAFPGRVRLGIVRALHDHGTRSAGAGRFVKERARRSVRKGRTQRGDRHGHSTGNDRHAVLTRARVRGVLGARVGFEERKGRRVARGVHRFGVRAVTRSGPTVQTLAVIGHFANAPKATGRFGRLAMRNGLSVHVFPRQLEGLAAKGIGVLNEVIGLSDRNGQIVQTVRTTRTARFVPRGRMAACGRSGRHADRRESVHAHPGARVRAADRVFVSVGLTVKTGRRGNLMVVRIAVRRVDLHEGRRAGHPSARKRGHTGRQRIVVRAATSVRSARDRVEAPAVGRVPRVLRGGHRVDLVLRTKHDGGSTAARAACDCHRWTGRGGKKHVGGSLGAPVRSVELGDRCDVQGLCAAGAGNLDGCR